MEYPGSILRILLLYVTSQIIHWFVMSRFRGDVVREGESRNRPWNPPPPPTPKANKIFGQTTEKFLNSHTHIYECCKTVVMIFFWCPFILVISRCHSKFWFLFHSWWRWWSRTAASTQRVRNVKEPMTRTVDGARWLTSKTTFIVQ